MMKHGGTVSGWKIPDRSLRVSRVRGPARRFASAALHLARDAAARAPSAMSIAESDRLEPAVEALLRAESWRAPAPALRANRVARAAARGVRWHRAQSSRPQWC